MAQRRLSPGEFLARYWFALALVALLILAIPGFILLGLNISGGEARVNAWLQEKLSLTYHIPFAWWLALILLLVPILIVLLYFLKLKRKPLSVPSTFLWRKSIEDLHVNALFQWLRQNILLLLQVLAVLFLTYAVMDFRVHGRGSEGKHYILMIDNSASMGATDVPPSRLSWAKAAAVEEIKAATDNDFGMVIVFNSSAEILQSYTNNRGALISAVNHIEQTQRPSRVGANSPGIEEALSLADSLANPSRSTEDASVRPEGVEPGKERTYVSTEGIATEVHVYSDGRFPDMPEFSLGNLNMQLHTAGKVGAENVNNVAIVNFNALRNDSDPTKLQIFLRCVNYRNQPVVINPEVEVFVNGKSRGILGPVDPNGRPDDAPKLLPTVTLPARRVDVVPEPDREEPQVRDVPGEKGVTFQLSDVDDRAKTVLHARLAGNRDDLPLDDEAWLVVGVVRKARILLVSYNNDILNAFFDDRSTQAVATVGHLTPENLPKDAYRKPARNGEYDLVVFDRCAPANEDDMPSGNTFFIGQPPPPWKRSPDDLIRNPQIKGWMTKHPIMRYLVALQEIGVLEAFKMKDLPPRTPRLIEIDQNNALLVGLTRQSFTDLVMTFPILDEKGGWNTNWPLLPSFPLFLRNVVYTLGNISDGSSEGTVQPGEPKNLRPDAATSQIEVADPSGASKSLTRGSRADFSYGDTHRVGEYRVGWGGAWQRSFAVNLLDADESNIEPRTSVHIGAVKVTGTQDRSQPRELWKWLVLAGLSFLLVEWYIYNRRVYV
jgi:hypothetical protein